MVRESTLARLEKEVGEFVDSRETSRSLSDFGEYDDDFRGFASDELKADLWEAQVRGGRSVQEHRQTVIQGPNAAGKDFLVACLSLWWAYSKQGLVVLTGPSQHQVEEILMRREIARLFSRADDLPGELYTGALRIRGQEPSILAKTASGVSNLTGFHDRRVLAVATEAQGVDGFAWDALDACATGANDRVLAVGNPLEPAGRFYQAAKSDAWNTVQISAFEHPNVKTGREVIPGGPSVQWIESVRENYGKDSPFWTARVEGKFPINATESLASRAWYDSAGMRHEHGLLEDEAEGEPWIAAVDPARYGPDQTALALRQGPVLREIVTWSKSGTSETVRRVRTELSRRDLTDVTVVVDEPGLGGGVIDQLKEKKRSDPSFSRRIRRVKGFNGGRRARNPSRFFNRRAEVFWKLRRKLEEGEIALPDDERLAEELVSMRWQLSNSGTVQMEAKDDTRSTLGRSPDRADAVAMAFDERGRALEGALLPGV